MNALFWNLLRTSLVVGAIGLLVALASPDWDGRFAAAWKKRLWCVLAAALLLGTLVRAPGGAFQIALPVRQTAPVVQSRPTPAPQAETGTQPAGLPAQSGPDLVVLPQTAADTPVAPQTAEPVKPLGLLGLAELVWLVGMAGFALRLVVGQGLFRRRLRRWARPASDPARFQAYQI